MCRLLLSINRKDNFVDKFIKTGTNGTSTNNYEKCCDGYGLIWKSGDLESSHISCVPYFQDKLYDETVLKIEHSNPNIILGHIRKKTDKKKNSTLNNQPFIYKKDNVIFMHNGEIEEFTRYKPLLLSMIHKKYKSEIKGHTDSEIILFLYLTFISNNNMGQINDKIMRKSMLELLAFFESNNISVVANIICTIEHNVLISRHTVNPWKSHNYPHLYIERSRQSLLVSTQRLTSTQTMIPKNTIFTQK